MARLRIQLLLIVTVATWLKFGAPTMAAAPFPGDCNNVCTTNRACNYQCYPDLYSFQNDLPITCLTWGIYETPCCGDSVCDSGETSTCSGDCPPTGCQGEGCEEEGPECGNDQCDGYETYSNCPEDCEPTCGDYVCDTPEEGGGPNDDPCDETDLVNGDCHYCPADCGACEFSDCEDEGVCDGSTGLCKPCSLDIDCPQGNPGYYCGGSGKCEVGSECNFGTYPSTGCPPNQMCNSNNVCREVV